MTKYTRWQQGRLLDTRITRAWSAEVRHRADVRERHEIFVGFTGEDQGRGRQRIAKCDDIVTTERLVAEHNAMIDCIEHLTRLLKEVVGPEVQKRLQELKGAPDAEKMWFALADLAMALKDDAIRHERVFGGRDVFEEEEESQPQEEDRATWPEPVFCDKSLCGTDAVLTCKRTPGHQGNCWASR